MQWIKKYKTKIKYLHCVALLQPILPNTKILLQNLIKIKYVVRLLKEIAKGKKKVVKLTYNTKIESNKHFHEKVYKKFKTIFGIEMSKEHFYT